MSSWCSLFMGDSRGSHTMDENDIQDTYISAGRLVSTTLVRIFYSWSPPLFLNAQRIPPSVLALLFCAFFPCCSCTAFLITTFVCFLPNERYWTWYYFRWYRNASLTPDSSKTRLLSPASFDTSFEHVDPCHAACTLHFLTGCRANLEQKVMIMTRSYALAHSSWK